MKTKNIIYLASIIIGIGLLNSCTKDSGPIYLRPEIVINPTDTTDTTQVEPTVSFLADVIPVFIDNCVQCHPSMAELDLLEDNAYNEIVNMNAGTITGVLIIPFDPENSVLFQKMLNNDTFGLSMPPPSGGVDQFQLDIIETWILEGALDN